MEVISNTEEKKNEINTDELLEPKKMLLELLNSYSYGDIMSCLLNEENGKNDILLEIKLKKLVDKVDIEKFAKLLMDDDIIKYNNMNKIANINCSENIQAETAPSSFERNINIDNNIKKKKVKKRKEKKKVDPVISKVIYRKNDNSIYFYRFVFQKKPDIYLLRCQDKHCKSKASYNVSSKEINIYEEHSIPTDNHLYLTNKACNYIKKLINYMKENTQIKYLEIYSDSSKHIVNNMKESKILKTDNYCLNQINDNNSIILLNKKRDKIKKFNTIEDEKSKKNKISKFHIKKTSKKIKEKTIRKNNSSKMLFEISHIDLSNSPENHKEEIIDLNEEEKENENELNNNNSNLINNKEVYFEIKDKYLRHNYLLTDIEQKYIGEKKRLGTHFHKNEKGEIYNYYGNNKEIKNNNMNYRCTLKGCKSLAVYNIQLREFKIIREHTLPYENHYCSCPNNAKTKQLIDYLKANQNLTDLQIILI
jgi:hypothetical protein